MILMVHEYVSFLARWKISPKQFFLVYALYLAEYEARTGRRIYSRPAYKKQAIQASLFHYADYASSISTEDEKILRLRLTPANLEYLVKRRILHSQTNTSGTIDSLKLHPDFIDTLFIGEHDVQELWDAYPAFNSSGGQSFSLKVGSKEVFENMYKERIIVKDLHRRVLEATRYGVKHKLINMTIVNYFDGEVWKDIEKKMGEEPMSIDERGTLV